jgi:uracil-DNA glycosylase
MLGRIVRVTKERGKFLDGDSGATVFITIHPSAIYRLRGEGERQEEYRHFVADMKSVQRRLYSREEHDSSRR